MHEVSVETVSGTLDGMGRNCQGSKTKGTCESELQEDGRIEMRAQSYASDWKERSCQERDEKTDRRSNCGFILSSGGSNYRYVE